MVQLRRDLSEFTTGRNLGCVRDSNDVAVAFVVEWTRAQTISIRFFEREDYLFLGIGASQGEIYSGCLDDKLSRESGRFKKISEGVFAIHLNDGFRTTLDLGTIACEEISAN